MNNTLSQLYSSIYASLGQPTDEILSRFELGTILFRRLSFRLEAVRNSEQAEQISPTPLEFTLTSNEDEVILTDLADDFVIPLWAEFKAFDLLANPVWVFLPTVHLSMLAKQRALGKYACSFFGENARDVRIKTSLFGNEAQLISFGNAATIHVWYSPTIPFPDNENQTIKLPDNLINMVQYDALVSALPLMIANASKYVTTQPNLEPQIKAWEGLYGHYQQERAEFQHYFDKWRSESRGSHRPQRRPDVLQGLVGGGGMPPYIQNG